MELYERIKKVRKDLNLTQQEFGKKIGLKQNSIAIIESGKRDTSEQTLFAICREFRVNEEWLRFGVGEMFLKSDGTILSELADEFNLKEDEKELIASFLNLTDEQRQTILEAVKIAAKISGKLEKQTPTEPPLTPVQEDPEEVTAENLTAEEKAAIKKMRIEKNTFNVNGGTINF